MFSFRVYLPFMRKSILPVFLFFTLIACQQKPASQLTIAAAANVQFAMEELAEQFTKKTGIECDVIISSSGKLTAQIKEGAPYDLFISADMKYPELLHSFGLTTSPPKPYALGNLVLWSITVTQPAASIQKLGNVPHIKHIALANPKTAPYGEAAIKALRHYHLFDTLQSKLVYGESISQVNQFVISKTAEVGFTAKSVVMSPKMKGQGDWSEVPMESYPPIAQGVVVVKNGQVEKAEAFYEFLFSQEAKVILERFGYGVP